jgi:hypothetical protein
MAALASVDSSGNFPLKMKFFSTAAIRHPTSCSLTQVQLKQSDKVKLRSLELLMLDGKL